MSKKRQYRRKSSKKRSVLYLQKDPTTLAVLDDYEGSDIKKLSQRGDQLLKYQLEYYTVLANQRVQTFDKLRNSLSTHTKRDFEFKGWQRSITYQWATRPLSSRGSLIDPGGRFNIGAIDPNRFPIFPALYIACDKETALQEHLGQAINSTGSLDPYELALSNKKSIALVSLSGKIENILDLTEKKSLNTFCNLIKDFKIPSYLQKMAKELHIQPPMAAQTVEQILSTILTPNWRSQPMQFDLPANSQIFGQIVFASGIEGILYPSKMNERLCLVIFPKNFQNSSSYIKLDDPAPVEVSITTLDSSTWEKCI